MKLSFDWFNSNNEWFLFHQVNPKNTQNLKQPSFLQKNYAIKKAPIWHLFYNVFGLSNS